MNRKTRVLVVYGSESGTAKHGIQRLIKRWTAENSTAFEVTGVVTGNELTQSLGGEGQATAKNLENVVAKCDVLLVATSSCGAGDPPSNYDKWIHVLLHEASMKSDALTGLQHAVLGYGSSTYATFQNIPRLTDKFLGECGSRRLAQRAEIDEHDENPGDEAEYKRWSADVFKALQQPLPPSSSPPACAWTQPAHDITMLDTDESEQSGGGIPMVYVAATPLFAMLAAFYWYLQQ